MNVESLITIVRTDYLDDNIKGNLWDNDFMFRAFTEAERQACNRQNLLFDDSLSINLISGNKSYDLPQKITKIEYVAFQDLAVNRQSKHEIERTNPAWRLLTGMAGKPVQYIMRGHKVQFVPSPDASKDADYIQDVEPIVGISNNDTWWDSLNLLLYQYNGTDWIATPLASLGTVSLEVFRLPNASIESDDYIPEIPDEYHRDLIYWVLHEAYKKQDSDTFGQEMSDYFLTRFTEIFGQYISAEVRLNQMQQRGSMNLRPTAYATKLTQTTSDDDW